jgi:DNA-binding IclR family transcriptional regulator
MQSVDRITSILEVLRQFPDGIGVIQLSDIVQLPPSSLHRTLKSLQEHELVWQSPLTRKYFLGLGLLELGSPMIDHIAPSLRERVRPKMAHLSEQTHATVFLALLAQDKVISADSFFPSEDPKLQISIFYGQSMPVHCAASAKAILAHLDSDVQERLINRCDFTLFTRSTIRSPDLLLHNLADVRARGFALCNEEAETGVTAVAAPAIDDRGHAFASIGLCAASNKLRGPKLQKIVTQLREITSTLDATG